MSRIAPELEAIADTCLSANVPETIGVRLQLPPELADQDAKVLDVDRAAPDLADQKLMSKDLAGVLNKDRSTSNSRGVRSTGVSRRVEPSDGRDRP